MKLLLTGLIIALLAAFYYHLMNLGQFDGEIELNMEEDEEVRIIRPSKTTKMG